jgi:hypothetical protein
MRLQDRNAQRCNRCVDQRHVQQGGAGDQTNLLQRDDSNSEERWQRGQRKSTSKFMSSVALRQPGVGGWHQVAV